MNIAQMNEAQRKAFALGYHCEPHAVFTGHGHALTAEETAAFNAGWEQAESDEAEERAAEEWAAIARRYSHIAACPQGWAFIEA